MMMFFLMFISLCAGGFYAFPVKETISTGNVYRFSPVPRKGINRQEMNALGNAQNHAVRSIKFKDSMIQRFNDSGICYTVRGINLFIDTRDTPAGNP
jgi:hypothetical protein